MNTLRFHTSTWRLGVALTSTVILGSGAVQGQEISATAVGAHYQDLALAMYEDAHAAAVDLDKAIEALIAAPSEQTLAAARAAWLEARNWYQQTEGYRFGNPVVDEWEGRVNAWPLDEGLIDYVNAESYGTESDENPLYVANVVAASEIAIGDAVVDARTIDPDLLARLHEADGVEANVATGYHAIEFLLWGQDLNGTGPGAGSRPHTDFAADGCTGGNCDRRAAYLSAASKLMLADLEEMVGNWRAGGAARVYLDGLAEDERLAVILTGLGSLSYGELAGERMKLGLILRDPEEEHDCFSDNTHNSHYRDQLGMVAIYGGDNVRRDGSLVEGPGIGDYARRNAAEVAAEVESAMTEATRRLRAIVDKAESGGMAYDQMLGQGNAEGNALVESAIEGLVLQTRALEAAVAALGLKISIEGSDSLDDPGAVAPPE
jgi:putative iron-regulated protein